MQSATNTSGEMTQLHFYRNKSAFNRAAFVKTIENRDVVKPAVSTSPTQLQLHRNTSVTPLPPTKPHSSRLSKSATLSSPPLRSRASASLVQLQLHRNTSAFDKAAFVKTIEDRDVKPAVTFQIFGLLGTTPTSPQHLRLRQSRICQNYRGPRCQARRHVRTFRLLARDLQNNLQAGLEERKRRCQAGRHIEHFNLHQRSAG